MAAMLAAQAVWLVLGVAFVIASLRSANLAVVALAFGQVFLLPNYHLTWRTAVGLVLIVGGVVAMQAFKNHPARRAQAATH